MAADITNEGNRLIDTWMLARESVKRAKSQLIREECNLTNSQNALARWMMPEDAQPGEQIAIWNGDSLIQVLVPERNGVTWHDATVTIRLRGRSLSGG